MEKIRQTNVDQKEIQLEIEKEIETRLHKNVLTSFACYYILFWVTLY